MNDAQARTLIMLAEYAQLVKSGAVVAMAVTAVIERPAGLECTSAYVANEGAGRALIESIGHLRARLAEADPVPPPVVRTGEIIQ